MKHLVLGLIFLSSTTQASPLYSIKTQSIKGGPMSLDTYKGKVVLVANIASQCGYTPQLKPLQSLYNKYKDQGLVVLGVPSNQFGGQTPESDEGVAKFCTNEYGVNFPLTQKAEVKGDSKTELFKFLTNNAPDKGEVKWNFEKFLVDRSGKVVARYRSAVEPDAKEVIEKIETLLKTK